MIDQLRLLRGDLIAGETVRLDVRSGSMTPLLPVGAVVEVAPAVGSDCEVGDVVVFQRGDRLIAHRLLFGWGHDPGAWFLERGDGVSPARFIRAGRILGRVVSVQAAGQEPRRLDNTAARVEARRQARRSLARYVRGLVPAALARAVRLARIRRRV
jgi:hypothetical protein